MTDLEIMQRAKMYMDQLAQGIDPISGNEVPDSICHLMILPVWEDLNHHPTV